MNGSWMRSTFLFLGDNILVFFNLGFCGVIVIRLAGPVRYDGVLSQKPWIGDGAEAEHQ